MATDVRRYANTDRGSSRNVYQGSQAQFSGHVNYSMPHSMAPGSGYGYGYTYCNENNTHEPHQPLALHQPVHQPEDMPAGPEHSYENEDGERYDSNQLREEDDVPQNPPTSENEDGERYDSNQLREEDDMPQSPLTSGNSKRQKKFTAPLAILPATDKIMDPHDSYHETITGKEAEHRLKRFQERCYLTRFSKQHNKYILSVYEPILRMDEIQHETKHLEIFFEHRGDEKVYQITDRKFNSLSEMLDVYERERVDFSLKNIGRKITYQDYLKLKQQLNEPVPLTPKMYTQQQLNQLPVRQTGPPQNQSPPVGGGQQQAAVGIEHPQPQEPDVEEAPAPAKKKCIIL